jgi:hypothetical protein
VSDEIGFALLQFAALKTHHIDDFLDRGGVAWLLLCKEQVWR